MGWKDENGKPVTDPAIIAKLEEHVDARDLTQPASVSQRLGEGFVSVLKGVAKGYGDIAMGTPALLQWLSQVPEEAMKFGAGMVTNPRETLAAQGRTELEAAKALVPPSVKSLARGELPTLEQAARDTTGFIGMPLVLKTLGAFDSKIGALARTFGHKESDEWLRVVRDGVGGNSVGNDVARAVGESIGNSKLAARLQTPEDLRRIVTEAGGHKIMGDQLNALEDAVAQTLKAAGPTKKIFIPVEAYELSGMKPPETLLQQNQLLHRPNAPRIRPPLGRGGSGATYLPQAPATEYAVSPEQAIAIGRRLRAKAVANAGERMDANQGYIFNLGQQVTGAVNKEVGVLNPALANEWEAVRKSYKKFVDYRNMVEGSKVKLFPQEANLRSESGTRGGVSINLPEHWDAMLDNLNTISPEDFGPLHKLFTGNAGTLSGPERKILFESLRNWRLYLRTKLPIAAGENIPPMTVVRNLSPQMEAAVARQPGKLAAMSSPAAQKASAFPSLAAARAADTD